MRRYKSRRRPRARGKRRFSRRSKGKKRSFKRSSKGASINRARGGIQQVGLSRDPVSKVNICSPIIGDYGVAVSGGVLTYSTAGTGPQFISNTTVQAWSGSHFFDPFGAWATLGGVQSVGNTNVATPNASLEYYSRCPDIDSYGSLYSRYRVNYVTLKWNITSTANLDIGGHEVYIRPWADFSQAGIRPNFSNLTREAGWTKYSFSNNMRSFKRRFYPQEMMLIDNNGSDPTAADSREPRKHKFAFCTNAVQLWGMQVIVIMSGTGTIVTKIQMDYEYNISFKHRN